MNEQYVLKKMLALTLTNMNKCEAGSYLIVTHGNPVKMVIRSHVLCSANREKHYQMAAYLPNNLDTAIVSSLVADIVEELNLTKNPLEITGFSKYNSYGFLEFYLNDDHACLFVKPIEWITAPPLDLGEYNETTITVR